MLIYVGVDIRRLEKSLQDPGYGDLYTKLKVKLTDYFSPKKNIHYSRYLFLKMRPHIGESTIAYAAHLREKAVNCKFHDRDEPILEHITQTSDNSELIRTVLHKKWTLQQTLAEMQVLEDASMQVEAMGHQNNTNVSKINRKKTDKRQYPAAEQNNTRAKSCRYCGRAHPMKKDICPAYGKFCSKCGKSNHFSTVCLSTADPSDRTHRKPSRNSKRDMRLASNESDADSADSDVDPDIDFVADSVSHLTVGKIKINRVSDFQKTVPIVINDVIVHMELDSGADVSVMDERQYNALKRKSYEDIALKTSKMKRSGLKAPAEPSCRPA